MAKKMRNVRISILDLVAACRALGEVKVVAAGSIFATLETDEEMRIKLTRSPVAWTFD